MKRRSGRPLLFLGVDTSSYTTSVALVDEAGETRCDLREPLRVPAGALGLRQSDAVFLHLKGLPALLVQALERARDLGRVAAVGVSSRPRPEPRSYLPVFLVGLGFSRAAAAALGAELVTSSHQQGHLACAPGSEPADEPSRNPSGQPFLALHASGGTTELAVYRRGGRGPEAVRVLGSSQDLHAGQFVDRVGQALGLGFPAGPALEALAASGRPGAVRVPEAVTGCNPSFSGPHSAVLRCLQAGAPPADVALAALDCVARTLARMLARAGGEAGLGRALVVGGVAANLHLRRCLEDYVREGLRRRGRRGARRQAPGESGEAAGDLEVVYPPVELCTDSAVGQARLARWAWVGEAGDANSQFLREDIPPRSEN